VTLADWRDLAVVLLALEAFVLSLLPAAIFYLAVRGMSAALRKFRPLASQVQGYFRQAAQTADQLSRRAVAPIIAVNAAAAQVGRWFSCISSQPKQEV
jgi:Na+-transporting methylmalonyl-CoA/oxaloacetate decarboxylase gamma subunit